MGLTGRTSMTSFAELAENLVDRGRIVLLQPPRLAVEEQPAVLQVLEKAFNDYRLEIAGSLIPFHGSTALAAAQIVFMSVWLLHNHDSSEADIEKVLTMPEPPTRPEHHLSADLTFRLLPAIYKRARALAPDDVLCQILQGILRGWPLSGVLSDVAEPPNASLDFGGHSGLLMLYAERLARHEKSAWFPDRPASAYVELIYSELGKSDALAWRYQSAEGTEALKRGDPARE
jgi:hypothetical protein